MQKDQSEEARDVICDFTERPGSELIVSVENQSDRPVRNVRVDPFGFTRLRSTNPFMPRWLGVCLAFLQTPDHVS